jgi:hypothetical protein
MSTSSLIASAITILYVAYRLLWAASQTASAAGLGRLPKLPKSWRRFLFGDRDDTPHSLARPVEYGFGAISTAGCWQGGKAIADRQSCSGFRVAARSFSFSSCANCSRS